MSFARSPQRPTDVGPSATQPTNLGIQFCVPAGSTQLTAVELPGPNTFVISGTTGQGVRLPAGRPAGEVWRVRNNSTNAAGAVIKVYPPIGGIIMNPGALVTEIGIGNGATIQFVCMGATMQDSIFATGYADNWQMVSDLPWRGSATAGNREIYTANALTFDCVTVVAASTNTLLGFGSSAAYLGATRQQRPVAAKTGDYTYVGASIQAGDTGTLFTNSGAAGQVIVSLVTAVAGLRVGLGVMTAQNFRVLAAAGDEIRVGSNVSAVAGYAESAVVGNVLWLTAVDATTWLAESVVGTWTVT